jgi:SAM-dependent methyltransferase
MPTQGHLSPQTYEAWYRSARGAWMGEVEAGILLRQGLISPGTRVLDVGSGTGWFSRRFSAAGAEVVGVDRDHAMLAAARAYDATIPWVQADMGCLPFPDKCFDVVSAVTSLCFAMDEDRALKEMLRTARHSVVLGLLHRDSLLYRRKQGRGAYAGAHWHTREEIALLLKDRREIASYTLETRLFWPGGPRLGRWLEALPGLARRFGGFLLVTIRLADIITNRNADIK